MLHLNPNSNGTKEPLSDGTAQMVDARRRAHLRARRATYAREHGMVREGHSRYHFTAADKSAIATASAQLLDLLKSGRVSRQHVEHDQQADASRMTGWDAAPPQTDEQREHVDNIRYRMAVRDKALDDYAGYELTLLDASTARSGRVVTSTPPRRPWRTQEANSAGTYAFLMRRPARTREAMPGYPTPNSDGQPPPNSMPYPGGGPKAGGDINISRSETVALRAFDTDEDEGRAMKRARAESGLSEEQIKVLRSRADKARASGYTLVGPGMKFKPKADQPGDEPGLLGRSDFDGKKAKAKDEEGARFSRQSDRDERIAKGYERTRQPAAAPAKRTRESNLRECNSHGECGECRRRRMKEASRKRHRAAC